MLTVVAVEGTHIAKRHMVFTKADDVFYGRSGKGNDEGVEARNTVFKKEAVLLALARGFTGKCSKAGLLE